MKFAYKLKTAGQTVAILLISTSRIKVGTSYCENYFSIF